MRDAGRRRAHSRAPGSDHARRSVDPRRLTGVLRRPDVSRSAARLQRLEYKSWRLDDQAAGLKLRSPKSLGQRSFIPVSESGSRRRVSDVAPGALNPL